MAELFDTPRALHWQRAPNGLTHAVISTPTADSELHLQGAHLTRWTPHGQRPVLFLSPKSLFVPGKAIRGGVPIIFPWFGPRSDGKPGPDHGFARTMEWTMESARLRDDGTVEILLALTSNDATRELFAADFRLRFRVTIGSRLEMELETHNPLAAIACELEHERRGDTAVTIKLHPQGKELWCDQQRITRLADHVGQFPTVIFSAQDLQLVRGSPVGRRRWLDMTLSAMDATYLRTLQTYGRALVERNALLKSGGAGDAQLSAFEQTLAPAAVELIALRTAGLRTLAENLTATYARLCGEVEPASLTYEPNFATPSTEALLARLESGRARDAQFRTTLVGPHRDDFSFTVRGTAAKDFASEGQQRSLVLALRLAQAAWFQQKSGVRPVLLADDVLGELDPLRRRQFWAAIDPESQIIATGTSLPDTALGAWQVFAVANGTFEPAESEA